MALRKILNKSDEILHKVCKPVTEFDDKLGQLLDDMTETLKNANGSWSCRSTGGKAEKSGRYNNRR